VVIAAEGHGTAERIAEVLKAQKLQVELVAQLPEQTKVKTVYALQASLRKGFAAPASNLIVLTEQEFYGRNAAYLSPQAKRWQPSAGKR